MGVVIGIRRVGSLVHELTPTYLLIHHLYAD